MTGEIREWLEADAPSREHLALLEAQFGTRAGVIPFVGAGLSAPFGFPQWGAFLLDLAREAGIEAETRARLDAAQYEEGAEALLEALGARRFQDRLAATFGDHALDGKRITGAVAELTNFPPGPIITTNFDRVLETAFLQKGRRLTAYWHSYASKGSEALQQDRPFLLKLHGDWEHPTSRVLTLKEYTSTYGDANGERVRFNLPVPTLLFKLLTSRCCLFLGSSLKQDRTIRVLRAVARDIPDLVHYALIEKPESADEHRRRAAELSAQGIRPIWYPHGRHDFIQPLLSHLADHAARELRRLADSLARPRPAVAPPNNIPDIGNATIGRDAEISHVVDMLRAARLVTITGAGGCGKSRLAVEAARALTDRYGAGIWFIQLADLSRKADREGVLPSRIAKVIGVAEQAGRPPHESLAEHLGNGRVLLILDSVEHLIASSRKLVTYLLSACPDLVILATSRRPIRLSQERLYPLAPLATPDPDATVDEIASNESVRLFIERVRERTPGWELTAERAPYAARICRELDGIPLALEVAAPRLGVLTVEAMAAQSHDLLAALGSRPTGDLRTWTLRAALLWSYRLLRPLEQRFMRALTVFDGGWTADAAGAVFGNGDHGSVLDLLQELHDNSLVVAVETGGVRRFRYLEPIRQTIQRELGADERAEYERRHAAFFLELAEQAAPNLLAGSQEEWLDRLGIEADNFRAAIRWCVETADAERGLRLVAALWRFIEIRGYFTEGRTRAEQVLGIPGVERHPALLSRVLSGAGMLAYRQASFDDAQAKFSRSLEIEQELGNDAGVANALNDLGLIATMNADFTRARDLYTRSLAIEERTGNARGVAVARFNLGSVAFRIGEYDEARRLFEASAAGFEALGNERERAFPLEGLGQVCIATGAMALAQQYADESLAIRRRLKDVKGTSDALRTLAWAALESGDLESARAKIVESLLLARGVGDIRGVFDGLELLGLFHARLGQPLAAVELFAAADRNRPSPAYFPSTARATQREAALAGARSALSPHAYEAAWRRGHAARIGELIEGLGRDAAPA